MSLFILIVWEATRWKIFRVKTGLWVSSSSILCVCTNIRILLLLSIMYNILSEPLIKHLLISKGDGEVRAPVWLGPTKNSSFPTDSLLKFKEERPFKVGITHIVVVFLSSSTHCSLRSTIFMNEWGERVSICCLWDSTEWMKWVKWTKSGNDLKNWLTIFFQYSRQKTKIR